MKLRLTNQTCFNCGSPLYHDQVLEGDFDEATPANILQFYLDQHDMTQAELARRTGHLRSHVSEYVNGKRQVPLSFIRAFAKMDRNFNASLLIGGRIMSQTKGVRNETIK